MSVAPIKVGETDKTLQGVAYVVSGGLVTGVKTDLVVADIDSLYVIRDQSTAVTISSDGTGLTNKTNQNDAHSDGAVWNPGDGTLFVDIPDAAVAVYAKDVQLKGTWTDGSDSGVIRGTPVSLTSGFDWSTFGATLLNRIGAFTGTGVNTILGFLLAIMKIDASTPSDVGGTFDSAEDSLEAQANTAGTGERTITVHVTNASGGADLAGCVVTIKDSTDLVKGKVEATDANGEGEVYVNDGPYTVIASRDGFITKGQAVTVSGDATVEVELTANLPSASADPTTVNGYSDALDVDLAVVGSVAHSRQLVEQPSGSGLTFDDSIKEINSDAGGRINWGELACGARYKFVRGDSNVSVTVLIPSPGDANYADPFPVPNFRG